MMMPKELKKIKRVALTLIPKQGFIDFINTFYPDAPIELENAYKEGFNMYLVPNFSEPLKAEAYLKKISPYLLIQECDSWQIKTENRPKSLNFETFQNFFEYDVSVGVYDTVSLLK
jgi:hypothetical protein